MVLKMGVSQVEGFKKFEEDERAIGDDDNKMWGVVSRNSHDTN